MAGTLGAMAKCTICATGVATDDNGVAEKFLAVAPCSGQLALLCSSTARNLLILLGGAPRCLDVRAKLRLRVQVLCLGVRCAILRPALSSALFRDSLACDLQEPGRVSVS